MFRRVFPPLLLLPAALLLCSCGRRIPPVPAAQQSGALVFSAEALAESRREESETESAPPLTPQETEMLFCLLSQLSACETETIGSTRRLAALLPPLWEWVSEHPHPEAWGEALRAFSTGLSEKEQKSLSDKLLLFRVMIELPETALNGLLEEAGSPGAPLPDGSLFSSFLACFQAMIA